MQIHLILLIMQYPHHAGLSLKEVEGETSFIPRVDLISDWIAVEE